MRILLTAAVPLLGLGIVAATSGGAARPSAPDRTAGRMGCSFSDTLRDGSDYYSIPLRETASSFGRRDTLGRVDVSYPPSPFGLPLTRDGHLRQQLAVVLDRDWSSGRPGLVAWVAPPELTPVHRLGEIGPDGRVSGEVALNKFLVFVTREPAGSREEDRWQGPVLLKGKSRSGRMQSMASHGMFEPEPC